MNAKWMLSLAVALAATTAGAAPQAVEKAASATGKVVTNSEKAVKRGAHKTADAMERGFDRAGSAVQRGAKRMNLPTGASAAQQTRGEQPKAPPGEMK